MKQVKPAIQLVENRRDCAPFESQPRYDVLLHGIKVGQLFYNLTGYVGTLPLPSGSRLHIGAHGISTYRSEVSRLNRE